MAARTSRAAKTHDDEDSLVVRWLNELDALGWPTRDIRQRLRLVTERRYRPLRRLGDVDAELARSLLAGPLAQAKAFTRADVVRPAAPVLDIRHSERLVRIT